MEAEDRRRDQYHEARSVPNTGWDRIFRELANNARREEIARRRAENNRLRIEGPVEDMEIEHIEL